MAAGAVEPEPEPVPDAVEAEAEAAAGAAAEAEAVRLLRVAVSSPCPCPCPWRPRFRLADQRSGDDDALPPELGRFRLPLRRLLAVLVPPRAVLRDSDPPNTQLGCSAIDAPHLLSHTTINMSPWMVQKSGNRIIIPRGLSDP